MKKKTLTIILVSLLFSCQKENDEKVDNFNINSSGLLQISNSTYSSFPEAILPVSGEIPRKFYLSAPPAGDQGAQGSCAAWAVAYGLKSYQRKISRGNISWEESFCSPSYVYNQIKVNDCSSGAYIHDALNLITSQGVCALNEMPYSEFGCDIQPSDFQKNRAKENKFEKWERIRINLESLKKAIANGFPIVIAAHLDCGFYNSTKDSQGRYIWSRTENGCNGYHAMVVYGYDDDINAFKVLNSWGSEWKNNGSTWIDYNVFLRNVDQAYIAWSIDSYNPTWTQISTFIGPARSDAIGFSINGKGFLGTGSQFISYGTFRGLDDFYQFDPTNNSWTSVTSFPGGGRSQCFGFSVGTKGFVGGGYSTLNGNWIAQNDFWEFDSQNNTWSKLQDFPGNVNPYMCFFSSSVKGFVFDGLYLFEYDPLTKKWTNLGNFENEVRRDAVGASIDNKCYIGLGYYNTGLYQGISANSFYCFDLNNNTWTKFSEINWNTRRGISYFSYTDNIYFGFGNESINDNSGLMKDFWKYNVTSKQLSRLPDFSGSAGYKDGFSIMSKVYVGLGYNGNTFPLDFWAFQN